MTTAFRHTHAMKTTEKRVCVPIKMSHIKRDATFKHLETFLTGSTKMKPFFPLKKEFLQFRKKMSPILNRKEITLQGQWKEKTSLHQF